MSESIKLTPRIWVANRIDGCYGVGELIDLEYNFPPGEKGPVEFRIKQGRGKLSMTNPALGTAVFEAGCLADDITLAVVSQPEETELASVDLHIMAPTGLRFTKWGYTQHTHGCADVGFRGELYLLPAGVSYENLLVREGPFRGTSVGYYENQTIPSEAGGEIPADVICENRVNGFDGVYSGIHEKPWSEGTYQASIPWEYCIAGQTDWVTFTCVDYVQTLKEDGTTSIRKFSAGSSVARPSDPTRSP